MKKEKPYEIFTDASFDSKTKIATYAIVIIQEKKIKLHIYIHMQALKNLGRKNIKIIFYYSKEKNYQNF